MTSAMTLSMNVEVMGCPTVCQHCWAMGRGYQALPLSDISWVLQEVRCFCEAHELAYEGYPMHEVAAHPQAPQVLRLFHDLWHIEFQPLPTTEVPLATRPDWREILDTLRELDAPTIWFAFHGADGLHDLAVMRQGAYRESLRAVERTRAAGRKTGCNLFVTKESIPLFDRLVADLQRAGMQEILPCLYDFTPNARGRHSEPLRPEWQDVEPLVKKLNAIPETALWRCFWQELPERHTESWYVQQTKAGSLLEELERSLSHRNQITLVCRPHLDVYRGEHGQCIASYGKPALRWR